MPSEPDAIAAYVESWSERLADGIIHAIGVSLSIFAAGLLLGMVIASGEPLIITATVIYGLGMIAMFSLSASYNLVGVERLDGKLKDWLRRLDHSAIYLMIAGTYTPFALVSIGGPTGYWLLGLVWLVALFGLVLKLVWPRRLERLSIVLYLALGWIGLIEAGTIVTALPMTALVLLATGGVLYSVGVIFHLWKSLQFQNAIWHTFVLVAAACHYLAIFDSLVLA
jgi:hemolysin III